MSISAKTIIGKTTLTVSNLERSIRYYTDIIGLTILERAKDSIWLGVPNKRLLRLIEDQLVGPTSRRHAGLYHFALLVPTRRDLALALRQYARIGARLGASDHAVSEALYLDDPDGHGIEVYADRTRDQWPWQNGVLGMTTEPLRVSDLLSLIDDSDVWQGLPPGTTMGHIHLRVGDVDVARRFYVDVLGFDRMVDYGHSATFLSAGGYHHHIGMNSWESPGAGAAPTGTAQLQQFEIRLPTENELALVVGRLQDAAVPMKTADDDAIIIHDPFENEIALMVDDAL